MVWFRPGAGSGAAVLLALICAAPWAEAQASPDAGARPRKSVRGTLESVDKSLSSVIMKSDTGERLAWRFDPAVIAEVARFKAGNAMIVIYRQLERNEKRVTAVAFPGTAASPIYVNMTGSRVVVRSAPAAGGECDRPDAAATSEVTIPGGGLAEVLEGCWCCAPSGDTCTPTTKSGLGRAFLVQCFE